MKQGQLDIVRASASLSRRRILEAAGIACRAVASGIDEDGIKRAGLSEGELVVKLAVAKALAV